jgi:AcrR family transcriptional regulator
VTVETADFQRARSPQHKQQRRDDMLAAARALGRARGVREVTLTDIAAEVGVHKSAVLRYFETREAVFLQLTAEGWVDWVDACVVGLQDVTGPADLARVIAETLVDRPLFCDLMAHAPLNLERGVSVAAVREFKIVALGQVDRFITAVTTALPPLTAQDAYELVSSTNAITSSLWQVSHPTEAVGELYRTDPHLGHAVVDFPPSLRRQVETVILGLLSRH